MPELTVEKYSTLPVRQMPKSKEKISNSSGIDEKFPDTLRIKKGNFRNPS